MPAYKDEKTNTWYCQFRYTTYVHKLKEKKKRGFKTKKEAQNWEMNFKNQISGKAELLFC